MPENRRLKIQKSRANQAFTFAQEGIAKHGEKYETIIGKLSMQIKTNGIGETIAFHFSKCETKEGKDKTHTFVCNQLREWLVLQNYIQSKDIPSFALDIVSVKPTQSRAITNELLALLNWLRRFTDGLSKQKNNEQR